MGMELAFFKVSELGNARLQAGQLKALDMPERQLLTYLSQMGGIAEWDELKNIVGPGYLGYSMSKLVDLGYVEVITPETQQVPQGAA